MNENIKKCKSKNQDLKLQKKKTSNPNTNLFIAKKFNIPEEDNQHTKKNILNL